jgi:serine/threonine protein kinase
MGGAGDRLTLIACRSRSSRGTEVWHAGDETGAPVVVKRLAGGDEMEGLRLLAEGRLLSELGGRHHLAQCLWTEADPPSLVLKPAGDHNLAQLIARGSRPLPIDDAVGIILQAADAVQWLHEHGIVHRDVKCSNLMVASGPTVTLIDLGVAIGSAPALELPWIDEEIGTLGYAAPELLRDPTLSAPTIDLYGLAATLYEAVSGHLPYDFAAGESAEELRARIAGGEPPIPLGARLPVPAGFGSIVDRGLAPLARDRHPTVAAFVQAVEPFARHV